MTYVTILHFISHIEPKKSGTSSKLRVTHIGRLQCKKSSINLSAIKLDTLFLRPMIDELENVIRNKVRLVAQVYTQIEGINFEETFAPIA